MMLTQSMRSLNPAVGWRASIASKEATGGRDLVTELMCEDANLLQPR